MSDETNLQNCERDYQDQLFQHECMVGNAHFAVMRCAQIWIENADMDAHTRLGIRIAELAQTAKAYRYCAEAALKDSRLIHERSGLAWQGFAVAESALDRAIQWESTAMRLFSAWVLDHEASFTAD